MSRKNMIEQPQFLNFSSLKKLIHLFHKEIRKDIIDL